MKKFFSAIGAMFAFALFAAPLTAPAAVAQEVANYGNNCGNQCNPPPTTPAPEWLQESSVWAGAETSGGAMSFGEIVGNGFTEGFSVVNNGAEFEAQNCGTCAEGKFTGRAFGFAEAGQMSFSRGEGVNAASGTLAQSMTQNTASVYLGRQGGSTPAPAHD